MVWRIVLSHSPLVVLAAMVVAFALSGKVLLVPASTRRQRWLVDVPAMVILVVLVVTAFTVYWLA